MKIQQAGCFVLTQVTAEQKAVFLHTVCPTLIYPYACHLANTLAVQGEFNPVHLLLIDFGHLYAQQQTASEAPAHSGKAESTPTAPKNKWEEFVVSAD